MTADRNHGSSVLHDSSHATPPDRRNASRRVLSCRVALTLSNKEVLYGFSVDISKTGIGVNVPRKLDDGRECEVSLSFFANGKTHKLTALGQTLSCVCTGMDGFRVSVQFVHLEEDATRILDEILQP